MALSSIILIQVAFSRCQQVHNVLIPPIQHDTPAKVSPRIMNDVRMRVADGRIVNGKSAKMSYMNIGPIKETNFEINTHRVSGKNSSYSGLLGMNSFKDQPFRIDANRSLLV